MKFEDQLAFSIASNPNTFALLLGSGISRPAKIPTGWEILNDLITQIATIDETKIISNPTSWFQEKYNQEPSYSNVLEKVAPTATERTLIIKKYFESSSDEKTGKPTEAHKAIAKLVKNGFVKVIITTNFDRLMEQALVDLNIVPTVIRSDSDLDGALPIMLSPCTIFKVNGDYLDSRIKNTSGELSSYEPNLTTALKRVLDEYGLITVGWSAQWDTALFDLIKSCPSRRFSSYWLSKGNAFDQAKDLINCRAAYEIPIESADIFFPALLDKIMSISKIKAPHPVSLEILIEIAKDYLVDEKFKIRLHDLVMKETELLISKLKTPQFAVNVHLSGEQVIERLDAFFAVTTPLAKLFQLAAMWGKEYQYTTFAESFNRIVNHCFLIQAGVSALLPLQRMPLTILLFVVGFTGYCTENMKLFKYLLTNCPTPKGYDDGDTNPLETLNITKVYNIGLAKSVPGFENYLTPNSDHFGERLWLLLSDMDPNKDTFFKKLDYFEYLFGLKFGYDLSTLTIHREGDKPTLWGPLGSYAWRGKDLSKVTDDDINKKSGEWIGFTSELFKNDADFKDKKACFDMFLKEVTWRWR